MKNKSIVIFDDEGNQNSCTDLEQIKKVTNLDFVNEFMKYCNKGEKASDDFSLNNKNYQNIPENGIPVNNINTNKEIENQNYKNIRIENNININEINNNSQSKDDLLEDNLMNNISYNYNSEKFAKEIKYIHLNKLYSSTNDSSYMEIEKEDPKVQKDTSPTNEIETSNLNLSNPIFGNDNSIFMAQKIRKKDAKKNRNENNNKNEQEDEN